jgi:hypothetical protein
LCPARSTVDEAGEPEARSEQKRKTGRVREKERRGRRRGISIRRSSTSMEAAGLVEEAAPYRRDEGSLSILPRDKERRMSVEI